MRVFLVSTSLMLAAVLPAAAGSWVSLDVSIDDEVMPLYRSTDGTRYYVEARKGGAYELHLANRSAERVGVELTVDGLNVISGEKDSPGPDRLYVLDPWENTTIRGWRTSLREVRSFTFVDEQASYATRSGKANARMGWIELAVYRERGRERYLERRQKREDGDRPAAPAPAPYRGRRDEAESDSRAAAPESSYPGTGWGDSLQDRVRLVDFEAERQPVERLTVRYEYRSALRALGVLPGRDRLSERERGEGGFARPPRW